MRFKDRSRQWGRDWYSIFTTELKTIFSDSGVMIIFFLAGLAYPLIYGIIYGGGVVEDTPVAIVDNSCSPSSRRFIRKLDATAEIRAAYRCTGMEEAERLMQQRKVNGIVFFPEDYEDAIVSRRQGTVSVYADMSSFLYYKNLLMAANRVMLDEMHDIQTSRYSEAGITGQTASQLVQAIPYDENIRYNPGFAYNVFFLPAALMLVIQQTMFYGMSMLSGTAWENRRRLVNKDKGAAVTLTGRGAAYFLIYIGLGVYVSMLVPAIFGLPQNGRPGDILALLLLYIAACVAFSLTFSNLIRHRETVFVLFLFLSPVCLFLTGFSWPESAFPQFWRLFSYIFPSTFAARGFINMNSAGCTLSMTAVQMKALAIQTVIYSISAWYCTRAARDRSPLPDTGTGPLPPKD